MGCMLTEPKALRRLAGAEGGRESCGSAAATAILDYESEALQKLIAEVLAGEDDPLARLRFAHALIRARVQPVYALGERQSTSRTLALGKGSCSQRMAVLEAVSRGMGTATRVRGLLIDGAFWKPRFPMLAPILPRSILLAWPEFRLSGEWLDLAELFEEHGAEPFSNSGAETLFEAVGRGAIDWRQTRCACGDGLADHLRGDLGLFDSRDELFAAHGENLPSPLRRIMGPVLERVRAG